MPNKHKIYLAPLQGHTDRIFRNCYLRHFLGIDLFFTPYLTAEQLFKYGNTYPDWNSESTGGLTIPQILPSNLDELKILTKAVIASGFRHINLNLGCPYPMVMNRGRGAGLLAKPDLVASFLQYLNEHTRLQVSIKTRLGIENENDLLILLEKLTPFPATEIIVHARTARQMYKGKVSYEGFIRCRQRFPQFNYVYNGDIETPNDLRHLENILPFQNTWMIGRGVLQNPFLPMQIKTDNPTNHSDKILLAFLIDWIDQLETDSNDPGHALNRVKNQFVYLHKAFPDQQKARRMVRKARSTNEIKDGLILLLI